MMPPANPSAPRLPPAALLATSAALHPAFVLDALAVLVGFLDVAVDEIVHQRLAAGICGACGPRGRETEHPRRDRRACNCGAWRRVEGLWAPRCAWPPAGSKTKRPDLRDADRPELPMRSAFAFMALRAATEASDIRLTLKGGLGVGVGADRLKVQTRPKRLACMRHQALLCALHDPQSRR